MDEDEDGDGDGDEDEVDNDIDGVGVGGDGVDGGLGVWKSSLDVVDAAVLDGVAVQLMSDWCKRRKFIDLIVFPIPRDAVTNGNGDTTTTSSCTNFYTF